MPTKHVVKQGEHLSGIAGKYGFSDYKTIWDDPENAELKAKRRNPHVLHPGDVLSIPDRKAKTLSGATGQKHRFVLSKTQLTLRLKLQKAFGRPISNTACDLLVETEKHELRTDGDGRLSHAISADAHGAGLLIREEAAVNGKQVTIETGIPIRIGHLDPVEETSGQIARLANLGYYRAPLDKVDKDELLSSIEEFQCENNLPVTGICDSTTQAKLKEVHGC